MKKFLYLLLPFLLLGHASQAQETRPSPWFPEGAEWYYGSFPIESPGGTDCIHMTVTKDTLLADRLCRQLKLEACDGAYETLYEYVYPCGDSLFYYNYAAQDFFLLMDMSAKKGDTIWVHDTGFIPNPGFDPYQRWNDHYKKKKKDQMSMLPIPLNFQGHLKILLYYYLCVCLFSLCMHVHMCVCMYCGTLKLVDNFQE